MTTFFPCPQAHGSYKLSVILIKLILITRPMMDKYLTTYFISQTIHALQYLTQIWEIQASLKDIQWNNCWQWAATALNVGKPPLRGRVSEKRRYSWWGDVIPDSKIHLIHYAWPFFSGKTSQKSNLRVFTDLISHKSDHTLKCSSLF